MIILALEYTEKVLCESYVVKNRLIVGFIRVSLLLRHQSSLRALLHSQNIFTIIYSLVFFFFVLFSLNFGSSCFHYSTTDYNLDLQLLENRSPETMNWNRSCPGPSRFCHVGHYLWPVDNWFSTWRFGQCLGGYSSNSGATTLFVLAVSDL